MEYLNGYIYSNRILRLGVGLTNVYVKSLSAETPSREMHDREHIKHSVGVSVRVVNQQLGKEITPIFYVLFFCGTGHFTRYPFHTGPGVKADWNSRCLPGQSEGSCALNNNCWREIICIVGPYVSNKYNLRSLIIRNMTFARGLF